ncbi:MAG: hypothetical protein FWH38_00185, partial [Treponema sp.]|nr:hypothetical protein [Treponema sp.]
LFQRLLTPVITAICASALYALLFFLVLPLANEHEAGMRFKGEMYALAKAQAQTHAEAGEWAAASQCIDICEYVWNESPELDTLRAGVEVNLDESQFKAGGRKTGEMKAVSVSALPGQGEPFDASEAIALGEKALGEGRFLDAHWLATLGTRIAKEGSPESASAARLAARAWNSIEEQQPGGNETRAYSLYRLKLSGYQAMVSGDWIRAFYIFQELDGMAPRDPDTENFLALSEKELKNIAFFMDEMEVYPGEPLTGVVFSLPAGQNGGRGRSVLRVSSLSLSPDYAYGIGIEYMAFDSDARPLFSLQAPYAKFLPITLDNRRQLLVQMRVLDRRDPDTRWEPVWDIQNSGAQYPDAAQVKLDISYEAFLSLAYMRQGLPSMQISDLFAASKTAGDTGYVPQVYEAEILNRLGAGLFFLPMTIIAITVGWCFRSRQRPRYLFIPMLAVLPVVFNGLAHLYRAAFNIIGATLILAAGFSAALALFIVILVFSFILSLILLAAQRG